MAQSIASHTESGDDGASFSQHSELQRSCSSCKDLCLATEIFRCSCASSDTLVSELSNYFCDVCIGSHIKQNHEVVDYKGYKPAVCPTHKMLSSMFCVDCDVIFCFKCLGPHCKHEYRPASEKACEVRKTVFAYLDQFDELAKPLAHRRNTVNNFIRSCDENYSRLKLETFVDELCGKFDEIIRSSSSRWENKIRTVLEEVDKVISSAKPGEQSDAQIRKLRELLPMSDSACVSNFLENRSNFDVLLEEQKMQSQKHEVTRWCCSLDLLIDVCVESVMQKWKVPNLYRLPILTIKCSACSEQVIGRLLTDNNGIASLRISEQEVSFIPIGYFLDSKRISFNAKGVKTVLRNLQLCALVSNENCVECFSFSEPTTSHGQLCIPSHWRALALDNGSNLIIWDSEESSVKKCIIACIGEENDANKFCSETQWSFLCSTKPKLVRFWNRYLALLDEDNKVTMFNQVENLKIEIMQHHHGLQNIDLLYIDCPNYNASKRSIPVRLILCDYGAKTVLISKCLLHNTAELSWWVQKVFKLEGTSDISYICMNQRESHIVVIDSNGEFVAGALD